MISRKRKETDLPKEWTPAIVKKLSLDQRKRLKWVCTLCFNGLVNPVKLGECGHHACQLCWDVWSVMIQKKYVTSKRCPSCHEVKKVYENPKRDLAMSRVVHESLSDESMADFRWPSVVVQAWSFEQNASNGTNVRKPCKDQMVIPLLF